MIPARVRSGWVRLRGKGLASICAHASQDSSHVGNSGVGVVSMKGVPVALPLLSFGASLTVAVPTSYWVWSVYALGGITWVSRC